MPLLRNSSDNISRRWSGGSFAEVDGFQLVNFDITGSHYQDSFPNTQNTTISPADRHQRIAELKQGLKDGSVTPNQRKNVERLILDLESGIQWYLYEDGRRVTHMSRNFSRVLWKEMAPEDI
ncbi:hypothetical protein TWF481_007452 [Arthrobotrys musiformis]|uniref:Uncharacterized protein n=1 Tax=Arthrobotrys musiformis TaxID=47236 RepID=A0AAV9WDJ0_9PEZI